MGIRYGNRALLHACLLSIFAIQKSAAALAFTNPSLAGLTAGVPYNLSWSGAAGTTTLTLQTGTGNSFDDVEIIASGIQQSFLVWTLPSTIPTGQYIIQLKDNLSAETINSGAFQVQAPTETSKVVTANDPLPPLESQDAEPHPHRPAPSHPNISLTAKIGVAVGSVTLTLLVIGIVVFYRRRHRDPVERMSRSLSSDPFLNDGVKTPSEMGMFEPRRPEPVELERGRRDRSGERIIERWS
ncbi:hypothetical protein WAI453_008120 [Rhynchosporium graminicola]|uniref:Yeast cell wall synthesis Kre9/Knh1-like N-terminal domain-containing protein n=1 Tax=Rhynchosporium graminicola TaxID=2792576 RepID=A0A1E1LTC2_9HELO|nr:uncharacterized protein RCO7_00676 [Rhynchosporium commune]